MRDNIYTESSNLDYPSVSQIASKLKEKSVSIIFAVTKDQFNIYEKLAKVVESSTTGELANDSSNIVDLIEDNYNVSHNLHKKIKFGVLYSVLGN
jgi:protocadherin alpha